MSDIVTDDLVAWLPALLQSLEALGFVARHLHPPEFDSLMTAIGAPDEDLRAAQTRLREWPDAFGYVRMPMETATSATLAAFEGLRSAPDQADGIRAVFRALRFGPKAQAALYPLAARFLPVSQFFLEPAMRGDATLVDRLEVAGTSDATGILHSSATVGERGGYSMYVPEYYTPERSWPLVVALHGGSGNGGAFLWSWVREARGLGAIVVAPTAVGATWALMGDDDDTPNIAGIVDHVRNRWRIDESRMLLTGMSDGGTFCYVSGLEASSPFTHLAPVAATFHPLLAQVADPERVHGLPILLTHGALDLMFPVETARRAQRALAGAGADVTYREIADLSHCYPREINSDILRWIGGARVSA